MFVDEYGEAFLSETPHGDAATPCANEIVLLLHQSNSDPRNTA